VEGFGNSSCGKGLRGVRGFGARSPGKGLGGLVPDVAVNRK
jgi:hypothetical protein